MVGLETDKKEVVLFGVLETMVNVTAQGEARLGDDMNGRVDYSRFG